MGRHYVDVDIHCRTCAKPKNFASNFIEAMQLRLTECMIRSTQLPQALFTLHMHLNRFRNQLAESDLCVNSLK